MTTEQLINKIERVNDLYNGSFAKVAYWTYYGEDYKTITRLEVCTTSDWYTARKVKDCIKKLKKCYKFIKKYKKYIGGTR